MVVGPDIRINVEVRPELAIRRPPRPLIELLDKPENEFRAYIEEIENSEVFQRLVEVGAIKKVKTGGRLPRDRYEEYMDVQLIQFLRQYKITDHPDWERDFNDRMAKVRLRELAAKYGAPEAKLNKMIDYFQRVSRDDYGESFPFRSTPSEDEEDYIELIPSRPDVDLGEAIVVSREFVEKYHLSEEEFVRDFLNGDYNARFLAQKYEAALEDVIRLLEVLRSVHIAEAFISGGGTPETLARGSSQGAPAAQPVARVVKTDGGRSVSLQFTSESIYSERYRTSPTALARLEEVDVAEREKAENLLLELQWINQRKTLLCRLITAVCSYQYRYLLTGELSTLKPLSQADIARQLGEDEATVCRLIRDKYIETPYGTPELKFFFQKKTDVVRRIVQRNSNLTDNQIRQVLERDYHCKISRRTVAYHRLKAFPRKGKAQEKAPSAL